jgi:hypothetical protein
VHHAPTCWTHGSRTRGCASAGGLILATCFGTSSSRSTAGFAAHALPAGIELASAANAAARFGIATDAELA